MEQNEKLIAEVKKHLVLYDVSSPGYNDRKAKNKAWSQVSRKVFNKTDPQTISKAKEKWKYLRRAYVNATKHPKKRHYDSLDFFAPYLKDATARSSTEGGIKEEITSEVDSEDNEKSVESQASSKPVKREREVEESSQEDDEEEEEAEAKVKQEVEEEEDEEENLGGHISPDRKSKKLRWSVETMNTIIDFVQSKKTERHISPTRELDSFFKGISDTVKSLDPMNQILAQKHIANLVLDYKLREMEGRDSEGSFSVSRFSSRNRKGNTNSQSCKTKE